MRTNKTMRAAVLLLALTLITSCFVGGTFAKYTTSATGNDSARVAYWGFSNTSGTLDMELFNTTYDSVKAEGTNPDDVVAPGTTQTETFTFVYADYKTNKVTAPEVDYTFTVNAELKGLEDTNAVTTNLDANKNFTWTLNGPGMQQAVTYQTVSELITGIKALAGTNATNGVASYTAGNLPTGWDAGENTITVGWNWAFEDTATNNTYTIGQNTSATQDQYDTMMGNMADLDDLKLTITITAEQIDAPVSP